MSQLQNSLEIVLKRLETEKNDVKSETKEKFKAIIDHLNSKKANELLRNKTYELLDKIKILREQVEIKESEKIEYEEGDLKASNDYADQLRRDLKKLERQMTDKQTIVIETYTQSEAVIGQLLKYKKKLAEIPAIKEADRIKAETSLENKTLNLSAVKQAIKEHHEQEKVSLANIADTEAKINEVLAQSEQMTNLIIVENTLSDKIMQYKEQIIPEIANEIEKVTMNISNAKKTIDEKNQVKNNAIKAFEDLKAKLKFEKEKNISLHDKLQNILKLKNDIICKKVSSKDIDENPNLKKLTLNKEYKKQKDKIHKLTTDKSQISKDVNDATTAKVESEKALDKLKEEMKKIKEISQTKRDEIMSLENDIQGKEAELRSLNNENLEMEKIIATHDKEKELIESNIAELTAKLKELQKKLTSDQNYRDSNQKDPLKESQLKAIDMKVSINNNKNNVHKWLTGLPQKFTKNNTASDILSQNSTVQPEDSMLNISNLIQIQSNDSTHENIIFNVDIEDPEVIDANMDCSFSEMNSSDIALDESFLNKD
ncbi:hypothetical protein ACKWTF_004805 [Chironomus riparius]